MFRTIYKKLLDEDNSLIVSQLMSRTFGRGLVEEMLKEGFQEGWCGVDSNLVQSVPLK